ncbi:MAG: hypothetical protein WBK46_16425 [Ruminococcus flavefaciens]
MKSGDASAGGSRFARKLAYSVRVGGVCFRTTALKRAHECREQLY